MTTSFSIPRSPLVASALFALSIFSGGAHAVGGSVMKDAPDCTARDQDPLRFDKGGNT